MISKVRPHLSQNESLLFERSSPGKIAYQLPALDVPAVDPAGALGPENVRPEIPGFPEVSEVEAIRHFTRLSTWNYAIDHGMYPLGSCTMKYNPRINELVARIEGLAWAHPYQPEALAQGSMEVMARLEAALAEIAGMDAVTLQPAAGAHGELTGILLIRALLEKRGNPRKKILIPDSAHGTNPASAAIAGYAVASIPSSATGVLDVAALAQLVDRDVAALMVTNPNTLGVFEENIMQAADILHAKGAMLYMDGANMNALVGIARPGDFGVDVMHLNLHKTFSTPHGGGGPGAGPVAVKKVLEPFLPAPRLKRTGKKWAWDYRRKRSIGRVKAYYGNFGVLVRALAYILAHGGPGLRNATVDAVTLQPAAGAHGELTGILLIRALLEKRGNPRKKILIPDSAHGTNPASATIAGYAVESIPSSATGVLDVAALAQLVDRDVAALMVTNPNTLGVFEENIMQAAEILHAKGAMLYMDGANMNALVGIARPGDFGVDVLHLNLHKTFSTPHGGGGPGAGPVAVKKPFEPFLPVPRLKRSGKKWAYDYRRKHSIGRVRAFYGNFGVLVRALAYILAHGGPGLRNATVDAVLNAVYIRKSLEPYYDLPYASPNMHEVVFSDERQAKAGVRTGDIAKRLIDYGFHPYTVSFPMIVHGALMIEPTETEGKLELDQFIEAMISIAKEVEADPQLVKNAPYGTRTSRVDEVTAARKPVLRWRPA